MEVLVPSKVVDILGSDDITAPCKDQDKLNGSSPLLTMQITCANSPSSMVSFPNVKGSISGGSVYKRYKRRLYFKFQPILIEYCNVFSNPLCTNQVYICNGICCKHSLIYSTEQHTNLNFYAKQPYLTILNWYEFLKHEGQQNDKEKKVGPVLQDSHFWRGLAYSNE